jgi:PPOX class probable F420-dependent enzyme
MRLETPLCRERFASSSVARLATVDGTGAPHLVPVTFAMPASDTVVFAIDHKPKRTVDLARVRNLRRDPRVSVLVDEYSDDWSRLWWVRADGLAQEVSTTEEAAAATAALVAKYAPYRELPPAGPFVTIAVARWTGWSARA